MSNYVLGQNAKLYYSATPVTSTTYATPLAASTEITLVKDVKVNLSTDKADISTRAGLGWKQTVPTLKDGTITFSMLWKPADANFTAILTAWLANAELAIFALDGIKTATSGNQGPAGNFTVTNFSRNESLTEALMVDVELSASSFNGWCTA